MEFKKYPHNPPHLFIDGAIYFITGGILDKRLILHDDENRLDGTPGRQVWWNYWDTCIRGDYDFETRLAYLYWNAVKHGVTARPQDYLWSSFTRANSGEKDRLKFGEKLPDDLKLKYKFDDF